MIAGVNLVVFSAVVGLVALWPSRRVLGDWGTNLAALPVGLLGWFVVAMILALFSAPWSIAAVAGALAIYVVALRYGMQRVAASADTSKPFSVWVSFGYLIALGIIAGLAAQLGATVATSDGWKHYELLGMWLYDTGTFTSTLVGHRALLPALNAANRLFGGSWTYVPYPMIGLNVAAIVALGTWEGALSRLKPAWRALGTLAVTALMLSTAPFVLNTIFMHSHMISALFIVLALFALSRVYSQGASDAGPWLLLGGIASAGLALSRPDGVAYAFALHALVAVLWWRKRLSRRAVSAYFVSGLGLVILYLLETVLLLGAYASEDKVSSGLALAMSGAMIGFYLLSAMIARSSTALRLFGDDRRLLRVTVLVDVSILAVSWGMRPDGFGETLSNLSENLLLEGGSNLLWYWILGVVVLSLLCGRARSRRPWATYLLFAVLQLVTIALVIHGFTHPGHAGWWDSLNRVSFHVVPLVFWMYGLVVAGVVEEILDSHPDIGASIHEGVVAAPGRAGLARHSLLSWAPTIGVSYLLLDGLSHNRLDIYVGPVQLTMLVVAAVTLLLALRWIRGDWASRLPSRVLGLILVGFVAWVGISASVWGERMDYSFVKNLALWFLVGATIVDERRLRVLLWTGVAAGAGQVVAGIVQVVSLGGIPGDGVTGYLSNHVQYAFYLLLSLLMLLPLLATSRGRARRALAALGGLMILAIVLSGARGVLIVMLALVLVYLTMAGTSPRAIVTWVMLTIGGVTAFPRAVLGQVETYGTLPQVLANPVLLNRLSSGRLVLMDAAWQMFKRKPFTGWGYGTYPELWSRFASRDMASSEAFLERRFAAHSTYLQVMAELGAIGICLYVAAIGVGLTLAAKARTTALRCGKLFVSKASLAVLLGILAFALHGLADNTGWHDRAFYVFLGLAAALYRMSAHGESGYDEVSPADAE